MAVSRDRVSAIPASSMIIKVRRSICDAQLGRSWCPMPQVSLARVSAWMPVCSARTAAAAADGARPMTCPPSSVQARVRARIAVVFPAPAGAIASCTRAPEVHIWRTSAACPASSTVPFAAISSNARSTATCRRLTRRVVRPRRRGGVSASRIRCEV